MWRGGVRHDGGWQGERSHERGRRAGRSGDRGSGTVWAVVVIALLVSFALGAAAVGGAVVTRHRAAGAADLAALAAADAVADAATEPCGRAAVVAERHGGLLIACTVNGMVVDVVVRLPAGGLLGDGLFASVRARAGPAATAG